MMVTIAVVVDHVTHKCILHIVSRCRRVWKGTAFGGFKSRSDIPILVERCMKGELPIDHFITHNFTGVAGTNDAIHALHSGDCLRAVVEY
jgi:S-(hydroxymethyl)glutathione dehydrogenase/alcohol dehydrogenase